MLDPANNGFALLPFLQNSDDIFFFFAIMMRVAGLIWMSPIFGQKALPKTVRAGLIVFFSILLGLGLYPEYHDPSAPYLPIIVGNNLPMAMGLLLLKELAVGYLLGLCFQFIYEATNLGGWMITQLFGLSFANDVDPTTGENNPTITSLMNICVTLLILLYDYHLAWIETIYKSFNSIAIGHFSLNEQVQSTLMHGFGRVFPAGLEIALFPMGVIFLLIVGLAFMTKVLPELNIFTTAFPLKVVIGYLSLYVMISYMPQIVSSLFLETQRFVEAVIFQMAQSQVL